MNEKSIKFGVNTLDVVQIIFIVLKCIGVIDWTWFQVLIPLWIQIGVSMIVILGLVVYYSYDVFKNRW